MKPFSVKSVVEKNKELLKKVIALNDIHPTLAIIQVGNNNFAIEANAHGFGDSCTVVNSEESSYSYRYYFQNLL